MPNQRSKDKRHLGGFVHYELDNKIRRMAKKDGMEFNVFGFCAQLMEEAIEVREWEAKRSRKRATRRSRR